MWVMVLFYLITKPILDYTHHNYHYGGQVTGLQKTRSKDRLLGLYWWQFALAWYFLSATFVFGV